MVISLLFAFGQALTTILDRAPNFRHYIEGDLDDIADYIVHDNPRRAITLIQDIRTKFLDIQRKNKNG